MNYPDSGTVTTPGKSTRFSSAARALVLGLALVLPGAAALAGDPIPGVDVKLGKNPGGNAVAAPTGADGAYQFKGLAPGNYDLSVAGRLVQTITVGDRGSIGGVLSREPDGKASITFNGQVGVVPDLPSAPVSVTRSNKKAGIAAGQEPLPDDVLPSAPVNTTRSDKPRNPRPSTFKGGTVNDPGSSLKHPSKIAENNSPLPTNRGINIAPGDVNGDGVETRKADEPIKGGGAPPPVVGPSTRSVGGETNSALGAVPTTRGRLEKPDDTQKPGISDQGAAGGLIAYAAAPPPKDGADKLPGVVGDPIPGVDVKLGKDPGGGIVASAPTGVDGAYQFTGLPAGKYKLILPGLPAKSITVGADGKTRGKVLRDGNNMVVTGDFEGSPARSQATANPVPSFLGGVFPGMGSTMGGILPGMTPGGGPGAGPMSPVASPMGPGGPMGASPMGPGAGAIRR